jgi:demethylmenaquinone methyltransferase/2-methoxy-6-polyprenyl-1,4-benzoquinol methylase
VNAEDLGKRFARLTTDAVVRRPALWRVFRAPLRRQFEQLAPRWDERRSPGRVEAYEAALQAVTTPPRRALDLGTGTGDGALALARRFPEADVVGVDLAQAMVAEARAKVPPELTGRLRFEVGDASELAFPDASFELVAMNNMIPFFDELTRVLAPGGSAVFAFSGGASTPIYVEPGRLRDELSSRGFAEFAEFSAGGGTSLLAALR